MFGDSNGPNWCYTEYQAAEAKAFLCVRAEEIVANQVDPEFGQWYRNVEASGCPGISRTTLDDRQVIERNHQLIRQIGQQIEDIRRESLFGGIPD